MNKPHFYFPFSQRLAADRGQGLVEYAILIAIIGLLTIFGLTLVGGSVEGGFIKVCAALGNENCEAVQSDDVITSTVAPTLQVSMTASLIPIATPTLREPDPTRQPILVVLTSAPAPTIELKMLRIKVVLSGQGGGKKSPAGIPVVVYNVAGEFVTEGVTDDKGNISFSVVSGSYNVATLYNNVWQNDGPFSVTNSKEHVIKRK